MFGPEEVLDVGARRRPVAVWVALGALAAGALGVYLVTRSSGGGNLAVGPTTSAPSVSSVAPSTPSTPNTTVPVLPPWPQRPGACGDVSYLPVVSPKPLDRPTGIRAVVGDRLATVDVDTGRVQAATGLPNGQYATDVVTTAAGTYVLVGACDRTVGDQVSAARVDRGGALHVVARGPYEYLVGGGNRPWAVTSDSTGEHETLRPLDGGRGHRLPDGFGTLAGFRDEVIGTTSVAGDPNAPFMIRAFVPLTGTLGLSLGPATSAAVQGNVVLWTPATCSGSCPIHRYDLATGRQGVTARPAHRVASVWGAVISPDGRTAAVLRPGATPGPYASDHPGNPNEVVTVDLASGAVVSVPGLLMWEKAAPGLAFSADGRWLMMGLDDGTEVRLLLWRAGLDRPLESPARLRGPVAYSPTVTAIS